MLSQITLNKIKNEVQSQKSRFPILFSILGDQTRFRIFKVFAEHYDICVTEIAKILGVSMPAASQQLRILETVGLLERDRMGKMICYKIRREDEFVKFLLKLIQNYDF